MPRPRTPLEAAKTLGAHLKDAGRYSGRKEPKVDPIGEPPDTLTEYEAQMWAEFVSEIPWLGKSDRTVLEVACRLRARMRTDPEMGVNALAQLRMCLSAMGATPADRSKVSVPDDEEEDEFFN